MPTHGPIPIRRVMVGVTTAPKNAPTAAPAVARTKSQRCVDVRGWVQAPANQQQSAGGEDSENEPVHDDRDHDVACGNLVPQCPRAEDESASDVGERINWCFMVGSECVGGQPGGEETRDDEGNNRGDENNLTPGIAAAGEGANPDADDPADSHSDGSGGGSQSVSRDELTTVDHMRQRGRQASKDEPTDAEHDQHEKSKDEVRLTRANHHDDRHCEERLQQVCSHEDVAPLPTVEQTPGEAADEGVRQQQDG